MRMEAANSAATMASGSRGFLAAPAMNDNLTLEAIDRKHASREAGMYSASNSPRRMRRFGLGLVFAALALFLTPALLEQRPVAGGHAAPTPRIEQRAAAAQPAPEALGAASAAQDGATQAPSAFSDALAAAPAGAQCSVEAHACSVPSAEAAQDMHPGETTVAFGFSQNLRSVNHNKRL